MIAVTVNRGGDEVSMLPLMDIDRPGPSQASTLAKEQILASMCQVDKREWWLWSSAISITLLLALGIASFAAPALLSGSDSFSAFFLNRATRGLFGLVLVFNVYVVYEQIQIHRIRHEFGINLYRMAVLDPVTGLFNRRYILYRLEEEISRCQRHGSSLVVITLDLDCFKQINDEHGHPAGDRVLKTFGHQLKRATRGSDLVARYGGDEFLAVLPDCNAEQTRCVLKRLDGLLAQASETDICIHYSAGWTDYIPGESLNDLVKRADDRLYRNKRGFQEAAS
jgi:diguanylate cyclase (GGDEF)-like protein